jgi:hypothetical protein
MVSFNVSGPCGALILTALAGMFAIEVIFDATEEEVACVAEFMLYSDTVAESHRKQIANVVRNAITGCVKPSILNLWDCSIIATIFDQAVWNGTL